MFSVHQTFSTSYSRIIEEIKRDLTDSLKLKGVNIKTLEVRIRKNKVNVSLHIMENSAK